MNRLERLAHTATAYLRAFRPRPAVSTGRYQGFIPACTHRDELARRIETLKNCRVPDLRITIGETPAPVLEHCRPGDTFVYFLPETALENREKICALILETTRRKIHFQAVGACRFSVRHDDDLLQDYLTAYSWIAHLSHEALASDDLTTRPSKND